MGDCESEEEQFDEFEQLPSSNSARAASGPEDKTAQLVHVERGDSHRSRLQQQLQELLARQAQLLQEITRPAVMESRKTVRDHDPPGLDSLEDGASCSTQVPKASSRHVTSTSRAVSTSSRLSAPAAAAAASNTTRKSSQAGSGRVSSSSSVRASLNHCHTPSALAVAARDVAGQLASTSEGRAKTAASTAALSSILSGKAPRRASTSSSTSKAAVAAAAISAALTDRKLQPAAAAAGTGDPERRHKQLQQLLHEELQDLEQQLAELNHMSEASSAVLGCRSGDLSAVASALNCALEPSYSATEPGASKAAALSAAGSGPAGSWPGNCNHSMSAALSEVHTMAAAAVADAGQGRWANASTDALTAAAAAVAAAAAGPQGTRRSGVDARAAAGAGLSVPGSTAAVQGSAASVSAASEAAAELGLSEESSALLYPVVARDQQQTIRQLQSVIAELQSQVDMLRARLGKQDAAATGLAELKVATAGKDAELLDLQQRLNKSEQVAKLAAADAAKASAAADELIRELRRELKEVGQQAASLQQQLDATQQQAQGTEQLRRQLQELQQQHNELQEEHATVQEELAACSEARQLLLQRLVEATQQVSDLHDELGPAIFRGSPPRKRPAAPLPPGALEHSAAPGSLCSPRSATRRSLNAAGWEIRPGGIRSHHQQQQLKGSSWGEVLGLTKELTQLSQELFEGRTAAQQAQQEATGRAERFRIKLQQLEEQHQSLQEKYEALQGNQKEAEGGPGSSGQLVEQLQTQVRMLQQQLQTSAMALAAEQERNQQLRQAAGRAEQVPVAAPAPRANPMAAPVSNVPDPTGGEATLEQSFRQHILALQQQVLDSTGREAQLSATIAQLLSAREVAARQLSEAIRIAELAMSQAVPLGAVHAAQKALGDDAGKLSDGSPALQLLTQQLAVVQQQLADAAAAARDAKANSDWCNNQAAKAVQQLQSSREEAQALQQQLLQRQEQLLGVLLKAQQPGGQAAAVAELGKEVVELKEELQQQEGLVRRLTGRLQEMQGMVGSGEVLVVQQLEARNQQLMREVARLSTGAAESAALGHGSLPPLPSTLPPPASISLSQPAAGSTTAAASLLHAEPSTTSVDINLAALAPKAAALLARKQQPGGSLGTASEYPQQEAGGSGLSRSISRNFSLAASRDASPALARQPSKAAAYDIAAAVSAVEAGGAGSRSISRTNSMQVEQEGRSGGRASISAARAHVTFHDMATTAASSSGAVAGGQGAASSSSAVAAQPAAMDAGRQATLLASAGSASFKDNAVAAALERHRSAGLAAAAASVAEAPAAPAAAAAPAGGAGAAAGRAALVASILQRQREGSLSEGGPSQASLGASSSFRGAATPGAGVTPRSLAGEGSGASAGSAASSLVAAVLQRARGGGAGGGGGGGAGSGTVGAATTGRVGLGGAGGDKAALVASVLSKYQTSRV